MDARRGLLRPESTGAGVLVLTRIGPESSYGALLAGYLLFGIALGTVLTWAFVRDPERPGPDPAVAGEPPPEEIRHHQHHRRFHL